MSKKLIIIIISIFLILLAFTYLFFLQVQSKNSSFDGEWDALEVKDDIKSEKEEPLDLEDVDNDIIRESSSGKLSVEVDSSNSSQINYDDTAVKTNKSNIRSILYAIKSEAREYFDENISYGPKTASVGSGVCADGEEGDDKVEDWVDKLRDITPEVTCHSTTLSYAVSVFYDGEASCVDNVNFLPVTGSSERIDSSKGYCTDPHKNVSDISSCQSEETDRTRWICVGDLIDSLSSDIFTVSKQRDRPMEDKIKFCENMNSVAYDYCIFSMVESYSGIPDREVCENMSDDNPWFKEDCLTI